jgi:rabconnectin-3b
MNSVPLVLPFTFSSSDSVLGGSSDILSSANSLINQASTITDVSCLTPYWLRSGSASLPCQRFGSSDSLEGVALGCEDGTLFLLRQNRHVTSALVSIEKPLSSRSPGQKPTRRSSRSHSCSRTPTTSLTPFSLAPRAHVVSAVSDEQAQAPKNYVDFDEESEKLKELLKGGVKDLSSTDRPRRSFDKTISTERQPVRSKGLASPSSPAPRGECKSVLSGTYSPTPSNTSLPSASHSTPPSPFYTSYQLSLEFHVFPPHPGPGNAVVGLHALVNGRHLICLRSQGFDYCCSLPFSGLFNSSHSDLSVHSVDDGSCVLSLRTPQLPAGPPAGVKGVEPSEAAWAWRDLFVHETNEVRTVKRSFHRFANFIQQVSYHTHLRSHR